MGELMSIRKRRVLVLFGNVPLLGQERGNIQVFHALRRKNVDALFVTNRHRGDMRVQPMLDALGLSWTVATYFDRFRRGMGVGDWASNLRRIASGSITLMRLVLEYRPTHIHVGSVEHFINFLPVLALTKVPVIYRIGDVPAVHRKAFRILWKRIIMTRVARFVCVSEYVKSALLALGASEEKCNVIYSEPPVRTGNSREEGTRTIRKGKGLTVLYVGQLTAEKGIDVFVSAAMQICRKRVDVEFLIAGDYEWNNELAVNLIQSVEDASLSDRIRFLGYVDAVQHLYQISDLHVLPSVWEDPLPNVVIEAKQAGIATVAFSSGGVPEIISHKWDGYLCQGKTDADLIAGIEFYINESCRLSLHSRNARASLARLRITDFEKLWDSVYTNV